MFKPMPCLNVHFYHSRTLIKKIDMLLCSPIGNRYSKITIKMETAYNFLRTDSSENHDELTLWMYLHIRGVPNNVFRFPQYCKEIVGKFRALPETHYPLAFVLWCKTMCTRLTVDDGEVTTNYDILNNILNATSDILYLPHGHLIYMDENFQTVLSTYLTQICEQHRGRNRILVSDLIGEIRLRSIEYIQNKNKFINTIRGELMEKTWHPVRVERLINLGVSPEDM